MNSFYGSYIDYEMEAKFFCVKGFEDLYVSGKVFKDNFKYIDIDVALNEKFESLNSIKKQIYTDRLLVVSWNLNFVK